MEVLIKTTELNELAQYLGTYKKTPIDKRQIFVVSGVHADCSQNVNALVEQMNLNNTETSCLNVSFSSIVQNHGYDLLYPDCLTSNIIHISNVYDSGKTFSDILRKIQEFTQRAVVIISMDNACLLNTLLSNQGFTHTLDPIVTPEVAYKTLLHFFLVKPGYSLFGSSEATIERIMKG
ncbi:hypothetical protein Pelo_19424 [Pelomyxa schiedti]|nr:hypothetical protein Pelo_19424 [Pelomyxa schiedti]